MAGTRDELNQVCGALQTAIICLNNLKTDCAMDDSAIKHMDHLLSGIETYVDDLCKPNSPQAEEYLRHAPCMVQAQLGLERCTTKVMEASAEMQYAYTNEARTEVLKTICCEMEPMTKCLMDGYEKKCGAEAAQYSRKSITVVVNSMRAACAPFDKCFSGANMLHHSVTAAVLSLAAFLWFWLWH